MTGETNYQKYTGDALKSGSKAWRARMGELPEAEAAALAGRRALAPYRPSPKLVAAVEYARILRRPLLLRGAPGSGKTRLAEALAYELYGEDWESHFFSWYIKSTTKAREGLYEYDHLGRLRDIEARRGGGDTAPMPPKTKYRTFGPMGEAFQSSTPNQPAVLLIDEIDKADIDFPNDLLRELEEQRFEVPDTNESIEAAHPPITIVTSNDEKELPNAFLRRCVFFYIDFPGPELLLEIAQVNARRLELEYQKPLPEGWLEKIVKQFQGLYQRMQANPNTEKLPSTSELLDWLRVLYYYFLTGQSAAPPLTDGELPHAEVLLKSLSDLQSNRQTDA